MYFIQIGEHYEDYLQSLIYDEILKIIAMCKLSAVVFCIVTKFIFPGEHNIAGAFL
jgi:hypothetical protein